MLVNLVFIIYSIIPRLSKQENKAMIYSATNQCVAAHEAHCQHCHQTIAFPECSTVLELVDLLSDIYLHTKFSSTTRHQVK